MNIEHLFENAKIDLTASHEHIMTHDYDSALDLLCNVFSDVLALHECVLRKKRDAALAANPPGENTQ